MQRAQARPRVSVPGPWHLAAVGVEENTEMQYNVWVHSFLMDDIVELPGTVVERGEVKMHPIYAEVQKFVFDTDNDEAFMLACERLDAVAAYEVAA